MGNGVNLRNYMKINTTRRILDALERDHSGPHLVRFFLYLVLEVFDTVLTFHRLTVDRTTTEKSGGFTG